MSDPRGDYREKRRRLERLWESQNEGRAEGDEFRGSSHSEATVTVVDLLAGNGRGPIWGDATEDLNLTLLAWPAGQGPASTSTTSAMS